MRIRWESGLLPVPKLHARDVVGLLLEGNRLAVFLRLLLLLTVVPFVELVILLRLGSHLGWDGTVGLVLVTGVIGAWLARREGIKAMARVRADLAAGIVPANAVVDGALILAAGIVLVTPGVLTDLCGFALLVPPIRRWVRHRLAAAFKKRMVLVRHDHHDQFIDVVATSEDANHGG